VAITTQLKTITNMALRRIGLRVETLTSHNREYRRLTRLKERGYFDGPAFPVPFVMKHMDPDPIFECLKVHDDRFADLWDPARNATGFNADNNYFTSPDAEVLYCMIRMYEPETIVEVGCGHSTRISRLAILDGKLGTRLMTVDPSPRDDVVKLSERNFACPVEELEEPTLFSELRENDILFIDSSHELKAGNDLVYLYLNIIPSLNPGVLIHIHDIFLPYDYPYDWMLERGMRYTEQYLVQTMLTLEGQFEVLWAGHYLQHSCPQFGAHFPDSRSGSAQSLWLRKLDRRNPPSSEPGFKPAGSRLSI